MAIPIPNGFKLPDGISFQDAQRAMQAAGECSTLVKMLIEDDSLSSIVKAFISDHSSSFPVLSESFEFIN